MPTKSRTEQLLNAYINGDDISNFVPLSRNEQILKDMILGNEQTSSPQSRIESLYKKLDEKIKQGSGGGDNPLQYVIDNLAGDGKPSCEYLFYKYQGSSLDDVLTKIDTSKVTSMNYMFYNCPNLTIIPQFNTNSCTSMNNMFGYCSNLTTVSQLDTSKVTNMSYMFDQCSNLTTIPQLDTSSCTNMNNMFHQCRKIFKIPLLNTSKVTNMDSMFYYCSNLRKIPLFDTSSCTSMKYMFLETSISELPLLNTSKVTNMYNMLSSCNFLTTIPQLDTSSCTDMSYMLSNCENLTTVPQLDTGSCTNMCGMFISCRRLTTISQLDANSCTDMRYMFNDCRSLTYLKLLNVKANLQIGSGTSWGHLIEKDCLIQIISELIKPSSGTRTLTMGTANIAKLADTYVKLLEDDGTGKYPFEVCTSTDEGAMTISDYCTAKNWTLA